MQRNSIQRVRLRALAAMLAVAGAPLIANAWAEKPVKIIVPAPAGGTIDIVARVLAEGLSSDIGQPVVVENKPGAGGAIAVQALNAAPPDGQTLMVLVSNILTEIPQVMKTNFDALKDVTPVTSVCRSQMVLVSASSVPATDMKGLINYLKTSKGGKGSYATYSAGTSSHYAGVMFARKTGLDMQHVPFPGSPPALQQVMGGQIDIMFDGLATSLPQIKGGKLRAYAVASKARTSLLPDVPTTAELGFPEIEVSNWIGVVVSNKVPPDVVASINKTISKVAALPHVRERLIANSFEPEISESPEKLAQAVKAEYDRNAQIVKTYNIKLN